MPAVYIAPPSADARTLDAVAASSRGYVYAVSRAGVTGTERAASNDISFYYIQLVQNDMA